MAVHSTTTWEVRTTGNDLNGGGFSTFYGGTDYSQQDAAQLTLNDVVTNGTTTVTSAGGGFTSAMVGNCINVAGAIRQITAVASSNSLTVDALIAAASGQTARVGGARTTFAADYMAGIVADNNTVWVKKGVNPYAWTGQPRTQTGVGGNVTVRGYGTVRGDGVKPILSITSPGALLAKRDGSILHVHDVIFQGRSTADEYAIWLGNNQVGSTCLRCEFYDWGGSGSVWAAGMLLDRCIVGRMTSDNWLIFNGAIQNSYIFSSGRHQVQGGRVLNNIFTDCKAYSGAIFDAAIYCHPTLVSLVRSNVITASASGAPTRAVYVSNNTANNFTTNANVENNIAIGFGPGAFYLNGAGRMAAFHNNASSASPVFQSQVAVPHSEESGSTVLAANPFVNPTAAINTLNDVWAAYSLTPAAIAALKGISPQGVFAGAVQPTKFESVFTF